MALHICSSNSIEALSAVFSDAIRHKTSWNQTSCIIVQSEGLQKWLIRETAAKNKIFANYEFFSPDGFIGHVNRLTFNYGNSYFSTENIKWKVYSYLNDSGFIKHFPTVANYYKADDTKRIQLAAKIADLFDQYQVYRPDIIGAWNDNAVVEATSDDDFKKQEQWQRWLWQKLKAESKGKYDQLQLKHGLLKKLDSVEFQSELINQYPQIHLFGIVVLSNYHWDIYQKLASIIDVSLYLTSPASGQEWYQDLSSKQGNDLLGSCKGLMVNLHKLLPMETAQQHFVTNESSSLLSTIQNDILNNNNAGIRVFDTTKPEDSIQIASSYTPVREVEALYNHLLNEFEKNPGLKGCDVSVQMTDVNLYAPLIKAVFDNAPKKIPYVICDQSYSEGDSIIKALDIFVNLQYSGFKAENVLQLFDFKAVRLRFDITDVELVREIIADANIRYGIEGNKEDETYLFSWKHGIKKLVLGYAIKGGDEYLLDDTELFPCDSMEGNDALTIFKIKAFAETVFDLYEHSLGKKSIEEWKDYLLNQVFPDLFVLDEIYDDELDYIYRKLENLSSIAIDMHELISFRVFREGLMNLLRSETINSVYTSGLVTFSSMMSVSLMPFKHIAVLGLNSDLFPRHQKVLGFDLMAIQPMANDRNIKDNDKHLFLEIILAAKKQLYLSYIGSGIKDNSEIPPSLLIEELEDYIVTGTGNKDWFENKIKYKHPLHASGKLYFEGGKFFTYLGQTVESVAADVEVTNALNEDVGFNFDEISLNDLIGFYKDPFKWYYNKTLRIYYNDEAVLLPEEEPFELDYLQRWSLKNELVQLPAENEEAFLKRRKNDGLIQLANMAGAEINLEKEAIKALRSEYLKYVTGEPQHQAILLKLGDSVLKGKIANIFEEGQVLYNVSGVHSQTKYLVELFIKHLAYVVSNPNARSVFISAHYNFSLREDFVSAGEAKVILHKLVDFYKQGHDEIIPFVPQAGFQLIKRLYDGTMGQEEALNKSVNDFWQTKAFGEKIFPSEYVKKEVQAGYCELLLSNPDLLNDKQIKEQERLLDIFRQVSELLFGKLCDLISTL
ncbi:exodeoxyribonuclease V subunit gamma [Geofilum sp. OHC36d9]|uniref:exodeoxyribonuclease V subunit gamma n=1 Tax=Geofilum sp. OHC36d9 TaxID=3458413 RepID=UPI004033ECA7